MKEALTCAKEALQLMKNDPKVHPLLEPCVIISCDVQTLYLIGRVLAQSGEPGRAKARKVRAFELHGIMCWLM